MARSAALPASSPSIKVTAGGSPADGTRSALDTPRPAPWARSRSERRPSAEAARQGSAGVGRASSPPTGRKFGRERAGPVRTNFQRCILEELRSAYLADDRPWVVGFSGGKDSTCLAQFVYYMLARLRSARGWDRRPARFHGGTAVSPVKLKPVYVLASDTRVEAPSISLRIRKELALMSAAAERDGLPLTTHLVYPKLNDTFWVNLIGRGYPSPTSRFRWCTDRLKIHPVSELIRSLVDRSGSVVVVLGARKDESDTRAQTMNAAAIDSQRFRPHADLPKAWVYTPLEDLSANEVWTYLLQVPSPWGGDNRGLITLYKQASGGECPLVIDISTASCGHSRFGCWTCTVVEKDRSMEALVDAGEEHLEPLLDVRDYLKEVRNSRGARYDFRRNGQKPFNRHTGEVMTNTGPFTHATRMDILRRVLEAQRRSGITVIEGDELAVIQEIWTKEENDHPGKPHVPSDTVTRIWNQVYGERIMQAGENPSDELSSEDQLLREMCEKHAVSFEMMRDLRQKEEEFSHLKRRHGLPEDMREIVRQAAKRSEES